MEVVELVEVLLPRIMNDRARLAVRIHHNNHRTGSEEDATLFIHCDSRAWVRVNEDNREQHKQGRKRGSHLGESLKQVFGGKGYADGHCIIVVRNKKR